MKAGNEASGLLKPGEIFGNYRVVRLLGMGGMGEVYEVEHTALSIRFALKVILDELLKEGSVYDRFKQEAIVMAKLRHPNIVSVDDFGDIKGRLFLRMELIHGWQENGQKIVTLDDLLSIRGHLTEKETRKYTKDILQAVQFAHEHGIIHRDLKPANILLDHENAKITDFGLVRVASNDWYQTRIRLTVARSVFLGAKPREDAEEPTSSSKGSSTHALLGSYDFMSPEQKEGLDADERSDLYSVGLLVYRMITGGKVIQLRSPSNLIKGLNPAWDDWVMQALEQDPSERFQTASEMMEAIPKPGHSRSRRRRVRSPAREEREKPSKKTFTRSVFSTVIWSTLFFLFAMISAAFVLPDLYTDIYDEVHEKIGSFLKEKPRVWDIELVSNPPGAELFMNDDFLGVAPFTLRDMTKGIYEIRAELEGYNPIRQSIEVMPDADPRYILKLEPLSEMSSLRIESRPKGARVVIESRGSGTAPTTFRELPAGKYNIHLSLDGYESVSRTETLRAGENRSIIVPLRLILSKRSGLQVFTTPSGATIQINDGPPQDSPLRLSHLEPGKYTILVKAMGYKSSTREVDLKPAKDISINVDLERLDPLTKSFITITTNPSNAVIRDSQTRKVLGQSPFTTEVTDFSEMRLIAALDGYDDESFSVLPQKGSTVNKNVVLQQKIQITMEPGKDHSIKLGNGSSLDFKWVSDPGLWVGLYEITNAQFRLFRSEHDSGSYKGHSLNGPQQPVVQVSYVDAVDFTQWLQKSQPVLSRYKVDLPTGSEWLSIAGGDQGNSYPWGNRWPPASGNYADSALLAVDGRARVIEGYTDGFVVTCDVNLSGKQVHGLFGIGGNAAEWTHESLGLNRCIRGAAWNGHSESYLQIMSRVPSVPSIGDTYTGFRIVVRP